MKKTLISLVLCLSMLISGNPFIDVNFSSEASTGEGASSNTFVNYGEVIGYTAVFNEYFPIPLTDDPKKITNPWGTECQFLSDTEISNEVVLVIKNYYCSDTGDLWYKVDAAPGSVIPEKLLNYPWIYQDNVKQPLGESLQIHNGGRNYVFDENGDAVTSAEIGLYDTLTLECRSSLGVDPKYQWQILVNDKWVDILGEDSSVIPVKYTLLSNALDSEGCGKIRCVTRAGFTSVVGDAITIFVDTDFDYDSYVHPEKTEEPQTNERAIRATASDEIPNLLADTNVCYITVQYLFDKDGTQAANSFVAEVPLNVQSSVVAEFPYVQGYLPYFEDEQVNSLPLNKIFTENELYTVYYKPTYVNYTVDIYFQNVENDNYSFYDSRTYSGLTDTKVPLTTNAFEGMQELLHETPTIAADGSTHLEIYYDRLYFMTEVNLNGGHGVYSVYARYGSNLVNHLSAPSRAGYVFIGWDAYTSDSDDDGIPDQGNDGVPDTVEPVVPARNLAYIALWKEAPTAQVNIVFWGENPNSNDDGYSYLETVPLHIAPGTELTYSLNNGNYICGLDEHEHDESCELICTIDPHTHEEDCYELTCTKYHEHDEECYTCNMTEHTTHNTSCYEDVGSRYNYTPNGAPNSPKQGQIYSSWGNKYIYIGNSWYRYNGDLESGDIATSTCHSHSNSCIGCGKEEHLTHTDYTGSCYTLTCTKTAHTHGFACYKDCVPHTHSDATCKYPVFKDYDVNKWYIDEEDLETVVVEQDGTTVLNVKFKRRKFNIQFIDGGNEVYNINEKWGANISAHWPIKGTNGTTYGDGVRWAPNGSKLFTAVLVYIDIMPAESFTLTYDYKNDDLYTMHYMVEVLPGEEYTSTYTYNSVTRYYKEYKIVKARYGYVTKKEDFINLQGFTQLTSNPTFSSNDRIDRSDDTDVYFYYTRNSDYVLEFYSGNDIVRKEGMYYEQPLKSFNDYIPPQPEDLEKDSYQFVDWYLNPELTGDPVDLSTMTMPAGPLALHSKWTPKYHNVRVVLKKNDDGIYTKEDSVIISGGDKVESIQVLHGNLVFGSLDNKVPPTPDNGLYKFVGWFYMSDGVELKWDFENQPVVEDTVIYAKWSSEVLVPYTIYFKDSEGNEIADPIISSSLAGHSITIEAKVGDELKEGYRSKYFPQTVSHTIPLNIEDAETGVEYTFIYNKAETKGYYVHYLDADNGNAELDGSPVYRTSDYAVVTETHKSFKDYVPDEYQKSLVLSDDESKNHLYFYYTKSTDEGVWYIEYYTQNTEGVYPTIPFASEGDVDLLNTQISAKWQMDISKDGFEFDYATIMDDGVNERTVTSFSEAKGNVTQSGLVIKVYFKRIKYPYKIIYLSKDTNEQIYETKYMNGDKMEPYGKTVSDEDLPTITGYEFASKGSCTIVKDGPNNNQITKNIVYVYYTERRIRINFEVVGPDGCGTVSPESLYLKYASDLSATVNAVPSEGYRFVGWYYDEACTNPILTTDKLKPNGEMLILQKGTGWIPNTYYAKIEPAVANLTIKRQNGENGQIYVYEVRNTTTNVTIFVTVEGNGSVSIVNLPMGQYTVTQQNDWSWRHDDIAQNVTHQNATGTTVTFNKDSVNDKWLNGNSENEKNQRG